MTNHEYPSYVSTGQVLKVALRSFHEDQIIIVNIDFIVDFNGFGQVMGFEIINLKYYAGPNVLEDLDIDSLRDLGIRCSYIDDTDVFYMRFPDDPIYSLVASGNVLDQKVLAGKIVLDKDGRACLFETNLS